LAFSFNAKPQGRKGARRERLCAWLPSSFAAWRLGAFALKLKAKGVQSATTTG